MVMLTTMAQSVKTVVRALILVPSLPSTATVFLNLVISLMAVAGVVVKAECRPLGTQHGGWVTLLRTATSLRMTISVRNIRLIHATKIRVLSLKTLALICNGHQATLGNLRLICSLLMQPLQMMTCRLHLVFTHCKSWICAAIHLALRSLNPGAAVVMLTPSGMQPISLVSPMTQPATLTTSKIVIPTGYVLPWTITSDLKGNPALDALT